MRSRRISETLVAGGGGIAAVLLAIVALLQAAILIARKLGFASVAGQEAVMAFAVPGVLLTIPWALQRGRHVAVEAFPQAWAVPLGHLLALVLAGALLWLSIPYAWASFVAGEGSYELSGFGWRWLPKAMVPLFALLLGAQALASLLRR